MRVSYKWIRLFQFETTRQSKHEQWTPFKRNANDYQFLKIQLFVFLCVTNIFCFGGISKCRIMYNYTIWNNLALSLCLPYSMRSIPIFGFIRIYSVVFGTVIWFRFHFMKFKTTWNENENQMSNSKRSLTEKSETKKCRQHAFGVPISQGSNLNNRSRKTKYRTDKWLLFVLHIFCVKHITDFLGD